MKNFSTDKAIAKFYTSVLRYMQLINKFLQQYEDSLAAK